MELSVNLDVFLYCERMHVREIREKNSKREACSV